MGANEGQYAEKLRRLGYKGLILSFEPIKSLAQLLKSKSCKDPNWHIFDHAIGDIDCSKELYIMQNSVFSSFLTPSVGDVDYFNESNSIIRSETVNVKSLNSIYRTLSSQFGFVTVS